MPLAGLWEWSGVSESVPPELLRILACPVATCRGELVVEADALVCQGCGRRYPVRDGIATLIPEEAASPNTDPPATASPHVRDHQ